MRRFWDVKQLAERLTVPEGWIYDRTRATGPEIIPHLKLGKYVRFDPESPEFQEWLDSHEVGRNVSRHSSGEIIREIRGLE